VNRGTSRRRGVGSSLLVVAVAIVAGLCGVGVRSLLDSSQSTTFGGTPAPPELEAALAAAFPEDSCVAATDGELAVSEILDRQEHADWRIALGTGATDEACVGALVDAGSRRVTLIMALSPALRERLEILAADLRSECHPRDEAARLVTTILDEMSPPGWELRIGGRINAPSERMEEVLRHIDAGCWIYSGTGWSADGTRLFWIGGK